MGKSFFDNLRDARDTCMELLHGNLMMLEESSRLVDLDMGPGKSRLYGHVVVVV